MNRNLILAGGGHAHIEVLRRLAWVRQAGLRVTLVSPRRHAPYSGMLPGLIAGHYAWKDCHIDLGGLCAAAGVRLVFGRVSGIDPGKRLLVLDKGAPLEFDWLSLNTGSTPDTAAVVGADLFTTRVKPMEEFLERWDLVVEARVGDPTRPFSGVVVGAGAGGVEVALALRHRLSQIPGGQVAIALAGEEFLSGYPGAVKRSVRRALMASGIELIEGVRAAAITGSKITFSGGREIDTEFTVWATGAAAPAWIAASGLATDRRGFLAVDSSLRSTSDDRVFAVGDVASLDPQVPKAGVFAVRQGPVLTRNLLAAVRGEPLERYRPQGRFLSLISLGSRRAVGSRGMFAAEGRWVWRLKDHIDRAFMRRYVSETAEVASQGGVES